MKITIEIPDTLAIGGCATGTDWLYVGQFIQGLGIRLTMDPPDRGDLPKNYTVKKGKKTLATLRVDFTGHKQ